MLSCFHPSSRHGGGGPAVTSTYSTRHGATSLTWSRSLLGLTLLVDLPISAALKLRPWRRGVKRALLRRVAVEVRWDLTAARFSPAGPDPVAGFSVAVFLSGDLLLLAGDLDSQPPNPNPRNPISRRESVKLRKRGGRIAYRTSLLGRKISIGIDEREEIGMEVRIEEKRVLAVTRLEWKFRGNERVLLEGGDRIQISWDFNNWFNFVKGKVDVVFVFRFEREGEGEEGVLRSWNCSESSFGSVAESVGSSRSAEGSSVMEWESVEEADLRRYDGFSLVVLGFKD